MHLSFVKSLKTGYSSLIRLTVLCTIFLWQFPIANAAPRISNVHVDVEHINQVQGLSQAYAFDIIEDKQGFIWIATQDGLNKYDGNNFTYFRHDFADANSLANNSIRRLFVDTNGNIWVGTEDGLSVYNKHLNNFTNYFHIAGNENTLADNYVWDIFQDADGLVWVTTETALHRFNKDNNEFDRIDVRKLSDSKKLNIHPIKKIFQDKNQNFWLNSFENGLHIVAQDQTADISLTNRVKFELGYDELSVNQLQIIGDEYWVASNYGISILDLDFQIKKHYEIFTEEEATQEGKAVRGFSKGEKGLAWIATNAGVYTLNTQEDRIEKQEFRNIESHVYNSDVYKVLVDSNETVWIGTLNRVFKIAATSSLFRHSAKLSPELNSNVHGLVSDEENVWFAHDSDLFKFQRSNNVITKVTSFNGSIFQLNIVDNHLLVLIDDNSLYRINTNNEHIEAMPTWQVQSDHSTNTNIIKGLGNVLFLNNSGQLKSYDLESKQFNVFNSDKRFVGLFQDSDENIWLTSQSNALFQFESFDSPLTEFEFKNPSNFPIKSATAIESTQFKLAIGSISQGLLIIDKTSKNSQIFNESNVLTNNFIADIVRDENSNLWLSTNKGVTAYIEKDGRFQTFYTDFSLADNEFYEQSSTLDSQGILFFGGNNGFHFFEPANLLAITQELYEPVLTELLIANRKVPVASRYRQDNFTLPAQLNELGEITLKHHQSPFSIDFVTPNPKMPNQVGYKYRLMGLDDQWIETDRRNMRATYTNLSAGDYLFEVQAFDIFNKETSTSNAIKIKILPPWWLSNSAVLIYSLISLLILAYLLQQFRHKRLYHLQIKASEERLKLSLWGSGDEMWDWNIKKGKIYRSNIWGILEFPQDGKRNLGNNNNNETNVNKADIARITQALQDHFDEKTEHFEATYRVKDKNDNWIWVLDRGKIVERDEKNAPIRMTGTLKDISQIKKADERLKLFAKCFENISDAVVIYDRQFNVVDVNKAFIRITGKTKRQMAGTAMTFTQYPENFTSNVKQHLLTKGNWHGEIESRRENGELYLTDLNIDIIRDENASISHFVGVFSDITKRKETEAELRKLANTDTLTGLPNRSYFQANQSRLVKKKIPHALLVFDLDNFKKVNDSMGHEVGDVLLCKVAERIRSVGRKQDTVYRLGGDEFSIIVENTNDIHTITSIAKHILRTIAEPLKLKNHEIVLYSSIGIVLYPEDGATPQELLKNADTAMYHAKHEGGNRYKFFNGSMNEQAVKRLQIEGLIRHGLKEDYFSVFYQPKIEIATGKIAGMEALVRFETPSKGIISPVTFIPVSEETGQIIDIGEVVLRKACYATKEWIDSGLFDGRCAVNLSAVQFTQPNLVDMISEILAETRLPAKHLELEITEGTVMNSPQQAIDTMLQIRAMGIHLSLDDFGTGYSSLAYLKKFPLNTLKIDKAFVDDIEHSEQGRNMVATIVTIAHNLGLQVVAEGVETNQQLSFLSGLRCEQLQGYLYSKPLSTPNFKSYLLSHQITDKSTSFS